MVVISLGQQQILAILTEITQFDKSAAAAAAAGQSRIQGGERRVIHCRRIQSRKGGSLLEFVRPEDAVNNGDFTILELEHADVSNTNRLLSE